MEVKEGGHSSSFPPPALEKLTQKDGHRCSLSHVACRLPFSTPYASPLACSVSRVRLVVSLRSACLDSQRVPSQSCVGKKGETEEKERSGQRQRASPIPRYRSNAKLAVDWGASRSLPVSFPPTSVPPESVLIQIGSATVSPGLTLSTFIVQCSGYSAAS